MIIRHLAHRYLLHLFRQMNLAEALMSQQTTNEQFRRLCAVVHGRVQGVNFRAYTARMGHELGLTGWVRNRSDGTVETVAEGTGHALADFLEFLHTGSPSADVAEVDVTWEDASGEFGDFRVK